MLKSEPDRPTYRQPFSGIAIQQDERTPAWMLSDFETSRNPHFNRTRLVHTLPELTSLQARLVTAGHNSQGVSLAVCRARLWLHIVVDLGKAWF